MPQRSARESGRQAETPYRVAGKASALGAGNDIPKSARPIASTFEGFCGLVSGTMRMGKGRSGWPRRGGPGGVAPAGRPCRLRGEVQHVRELARVQRAADGGHVVQVRLHGVHPEAGAYTRFTLQVDVSAFCVSGVSTGCLEGIYGRGGKGVEGFRGCFGCQKRLSLS